MVYRVSYVIVLASLMAAAANASNDPFIGQWKVNPSKSSIVDVMKIKSVGGNKYVFDVGGGVERIAVDGTDQPGVAGTVLSVSPEGPNLWRVVRKKAGRMLLTANWGLSKDDKTLTDEFTAIGSDGKRSTTRFVYRRVGGSSGFAGKWESRNNATMDFSFLISVQPYEGDGLSVMDPTDGLTMNVKFDGKDYASGGSNAPKGFTASARRVNQHTMEIAAKVNGKTALTQVMSLSSDLKTLTVTQRIGQREPNTYVLERL
jgi:hypothetical protein